MTSQVMALATLPGQTGGMSQLTETDIPAPKSRPSEPASESAPVEPRVRTLRWALASNAAFSAATGLAMLTFSGVLAQLLGGVPPSAYQVVGLALLGFALFIGYGLRSRRPHGLLSLGISMADFSWVLATSALLPVLDWTVVGTGTVVTVNLVVASFGIWQLVGIDRSYRTPTNALRVCISLDVPVGADAFFGAVRELDSIADHFSALRSSRLRQGGAPGVGAVRQCEDRGGKRWAERCTRLDPVSRVLELEFLTDEPGFPFPFRTMRGVWQVDPRGASSTVRVSWEMVPTRRWLAPLLLPSFEAAARRAFPPVVRSMARLQPRREQLRAVAC